MRNLTCLSAMCIVIDHQDQIELNIPETKLRPTALKWRLILDAQEFCRIFLLSCDSNIGKVTS